MTAASGASMRSWTSSNSPGMVKFTTTERPSSETVSARSSLFSGLWISETPSSFPSRRTTSSTAAWTSGSSALIEPLPWMSTCSTTSSG